MKQFIILAAVILIGCAPTISERFDQLALTARDRCEADGGIYTMQTRNWGRERDGLQFGICSR